MVLMPVKYHLIGKEGMTSGSWWWEEVRWGWWRLEVCGSVVHVDPHLSSSDGHIKQVNEVNTALTDSPPVNWEEQSWAEAPLCQVPHCSAKGRFMVRVKPRTDASVSGWSDQVIKVIMWSICINFLLSRISELISFVRHSIFHRHYIFHRKSGSNEMCPVGMFFDVVGHMDRSCLSVYLMRVK